MLDPLGPPSPPLLVIVMGVAGSGKTTIGALLASELGCPFWDADSFHSEASIQKMRSGTPLTDGDREPWLRMLRDQVVNAVAGKGVGVLACSSLKASHQRMLADGKDQVRFVYLRVAPELARMRLQGRASHFMNPALIESQFAELEEPEDAIAVDGSLPPTTILEGILRGLSAPAVAAATAGMPPQEAVTLDAATLASLKSVWSEVETTEAFDADRAVALLVNRFRRYEASLWRIVEAADNQKALMEHRRASGQEAEAGDEPRLDALRKVAQIAGLALSPPRWLVSRAMDQAAPSDPAPDSIRP